MVKCQFFAHFITCQNQIFSFIILYSVFLKVQIHIIFKLLDQNNPIMYNLNMFLKSVFSESCIVFFSTKSLCKISASASYPRNLLLYPEFLRMSLVIHKTAEFSCRNVVPDSAFTATQKSFHVNALLARTPTHRRLTRNSPKILNWTC